MAWWSNIAGTALGYFRLGLSGVRLKNDAGALSVRNAGDSAVANAKFGAWLNTDGTENYKCRAWVNFNGTGTVAIRASGNVSSITDNGVGDYTVNFTTAMPDANYAIQTSFGGQTSSAYFSINTSIVPQTTSAARIRSGTVTSAGVDAIDCHVSVFR